MVENKDWDALLKYLSYNFKRNPKLPEDFDKKYIKKLEFTIDSYNEKLDSKAKEVSFEDESIVIEFRNFVPYNPQDNYNSINFKLLNDGNEVILDSEYIKDNKLYIPIEFIGNGENKIITVYNYDDIKKESFMQTAVTKSFDCNVCEINVKKGFTENLLLIKREKKDINLIIENVELTDNKLSFKGTIDKQLESVLMTDYLNIIKFLYPIKYLSDDEIIFEIDCSDLFKAPIKKWELSSYKKFNRINVTQEYEFIDGKNLISISNQKSRTLIEIKSNRTKEETDDEDSDKPKIENKKYF